MITNISFFREKVSLFLFYLDIFCFNKLKLNFAFNILSNKMYDGSRRKTKCLIFIIITFSFVFRREKFSSSASSFIRARAKIFARLIAKKRHNSRDNDCVIERCVWLIIIDETRVNHDDSPTSERR